MSDDRLIVVILPQGRGPALLEALYERKLLRAWLGSARAPFTYVKRRGGIARTVRHSVEKDVLNVIAPAELAHDVFAFLHDKAEVARAPGAFMFMGSLAQASAFSLPSDAPSA